MDCDVIQLPQRFAIDTRGDVRDRATAAIDGGCRSLVLDGERTVAMDLPALGVLVRLTREMWSRGGQLVVAGLCDELQSLTSIVSLGGALTIASSVDVARAFLRDVPPPPTTPENPPHA